MTGPTGRAGFTLTELLIGMIVLAVLGIGMVTLLRVQHQTYNQQNEGVLATQNARAALDMMTKEIRNAAFDPYGDASATMVYWLEDALEFTADLNGDGDVSDPDERVRYYHYWPTNTLVRREGGVNGTVATRITDVDFNYFSDENGTLATSADEIEQIRIRIEYETPEGVLVGDLETTVALRNQIY